MDIVLSPALEAKYSLLPSQKSSLISNPVLGEIDLTKMTEYEVQRMEESDIVFPFLKLKKISSKSVITD